MCVAKKRLALLHFDLFCISGSYGEYVFILVIYFGTWTHSLEPRNPSKIMFISTATSLLSTFCNAYSRLSLGTRIQRNFKRTPKMFHPREANVSLDQKSHASQNKNSPFRYSACIWWSRKLRVGLRGNDLSHISSISSLQLGASHTCFRKERCRVLSIHFALDATILEMPLSCNSTASNICTFQNFLFCVWLFWVYSVFPCFPSSSNEYSKSVQRKDPRSIQTWFWCNLWVCVKHWVPQKFSIANCQNFPSILR